MKLNPKKCLFGVKSGKLLGFMVSKRGIDANPTKVQAALDLPKPKTKRDVQRLTGRIAALSRFISRASDKGLPFFKALKFPKSKELIWEDEQREAFKQFREHLAQLPKLARPAEGETLYLYVAVSPATISAPLEKVHDKVEKSGRLAKWAFELTEFSINYQPRAVIKAQALAYFLAECSYQETLDEEKKIWTVFTDGSSTVNGSGAGVVITSPEGKSFEYALKFSFKASNNEAEYEAAIAGLELCISSEAKHVCLKTDSQLVANEIRGEYEAKEPSMIAYLAKIKPIMAKLRTFEVQLILNAQANALSKLASSTLTELNQSVYVEVRREKSIDEVPEVCCVDHEPSWMDPILAYKLRGEILEDKILASKVMRTNSRFIFFRGELLKNSFSAPFLKCVGATDADYILREIHLGICGNHIGERTLAHKALRSASFGIKLAYSAVCHPQSNGQAEAANKQILNALKKRVEDQKSKWIEELPATLWSLRTTEKETMGHSPFELVYGAEAILPVEIGSESLRVHHFSAENEQLMKESLDFLDEISILKDRQKAKKKSVKY
ncbi:uncharacterized protein LOC110686982 [Chenopodium quinoa]|uniref:uncharacterized protein LOC110686982 n=1 Tax=Chenopodium quinoa TaxID=63459 RepID=UPI000B788E22|nr:uncharacterized protein LOC110686982 [Chenopodium quinoa]